LGPRPHYRVIYPELDEATLTDIAESFTFSYQGGRDPHAYSVPLREAVRAWTEACERRLTRGSLAYRRGPGFLRIVDRQPGLPGAHWTFGENEARVFLACKDGATPAEALAALPPEEANDLGVAWVAEWLEELVAERLAYEEGGRYLTLALPERPERAEGRTTAAVTTKPAVEPYPMMERRLTKERPQAEAAR
jgi:hypothetical protein